MSTLEICETQNISKANRKAVEETANGNDSKILEIEVMTSQPYNTQNVDQTFEKSTEEVLNDGNKLTEFQSMFSHVLYTQNENEKAANETFNESELSESRTFGNFDLKHFGESNEKLVEEKFNKSGDKFTEISNTLNKVNNTNEASLETLNEFELTEFESAVSENITQTSDQLIDQIFNLDLICASGDTTEDLFKNYENSVVETLNEKRNEFPDFELNTSQVLNTQANKEDEILLEKTLKENGNKLSERESPTFQVFNTQNVNDRNGKSVDEITHENANPKLIRTSDISDSQHLGGTCENLEEEIFNESVEKLTDMSDKHEDTQGAVETEESVLDDTMTKNEAALPEFEFAAYLKTTHDNRIYGVQFYNDLIFATVGGNNVTIYECDPEEIKPLKTYVDPNKNEIFYTCCWSQNLLTSKAILSFAGFHGILKVIYPTCKTPPQVHYGHGRPINHLTVHPKDPSILLSASDDHTLRLWNIESGQCIAVFGGAEGHNAQVAYADFDAMGSRIISCGVDNALKIWRLDGSPIKELIQLSFSIPNCNTNSFKTFQCHFPEFTTKVIHRGIVDCVKWHGNLILSKSIQNAIICWAPGSFTNTSSYIKVDYATVIHRFDFNDCNYWFVRFSLDSAKKFMAIGNNVGKTFVWLLDCHNPTKYTILEHEECTTTVRQTAFSPDGKILICVCDDNTVFRWNMK